MFMLFSGPVSATVPAAFANPAVMAVGLVILLAIFVWMKLAE
jgi:hypothetical protein